MTNYHSVVNTAKNNRLIRAEIREYVLGMALYYGFYKDTKTATQLYEKDRNAEHRIRQCTFLSVGREHGIDMFCHVISEPATHVVERYIATTMSSYFKVYKKSGVYYTFFDTKKFRIYYNRLVWGRDKKITLRHTIQYIWTDYLALLFCIFGKHQYYDPFYIDLSQFHMYRFAKNKDETDAYIQAYLRDVVGIRDGVKVLNGTIYFATEQLYLQFWIIANKEARRICEKLFKGGYLGKDDSNNQGTDISRKVKGHRRPARNLKSASRHKRGRRAHSVSRQ